MAIFYDGYGGCCVCTREKCSYECSTYRSYKPIPVTNYDRIISMTPDELADFLDKVDPVFWKRETWLDWLRKEAEEGE